MSDGSDGYTELHWAAASCQVDRLWHALLDPVTVVNAVTTKQGWTALHIAARSGFTPIIEALLEHGAIDTRIRDHDGQTALHIASDCNHSAAAKCLMAAGGTSEEEVRQASGRMALEERTREKNDQRLGVSTADRRQREATEERSHGQQQKKLQELRDKQATREEVAPPSKPTAPGGPGAGDSRDQGRGGNARAGGSCAAADENHDDTQTSRIAQTRQLPPPTGTRRSAYLAALFGHRQAPPVTAGAAAATTSRRTREPPASAAQPRAEVVSTARRGRLTYALRARVLPVGKLATGEFASDLTSSRRFYPPAKCRVYEKDHPALPSVSVGSGVSWNNRSWRLHTSAAPQRISSD